MLVVVSPFSSLLTNCRRIVSQDGSSADSVSGAGPSTVNSSSLDASSVRLINSFIWCRTQRSRTSGTKRKRASTVSPLCLSSHLACSPSPVLLTQAQRVAQGCQTGQDDGDAYDAQQESPHRHEEDSPRPSQGHQDETAPGPGDKVVLPPSSEEYRV